MVRLTLPAVGILTGWLLWFPALPLASAGDAQAEAFFETKIRPILVERCYRCHSAESGKTQGGLALDSRSGWQQGGDSGPALVPGKVEESLLIRAVQYREDGPQMPPEDGGGRLPEAEISLLVEWVRSGAFDPRTEVGRGGLTAKQIRDWWSFQPLQNPTAPSSTAPDSSHLVDDFLDARLAAAGLARSSEADPRTLIRRVTYDLTGLPPTPAEVDAFLADSSPQAYEQLIERLLQSPRYGERWGRHWLDLVRYADTAGENTDHPIPDAWRYRNWVIDAFQRNLPYDEFVREQIAGDLIHAHDDTQRYADGVIATGFLAIARRFDHDSDKHMHLTYEDTIDTLGKAFVGLSIACARCHDHKYDPISSDDYYALYGILASTRFAFPGCEAKQQPRDLVPLLPPNQWAQSIEPYDRRLAALDATLKQLDEARASATKEFQAATNASESLLAQGEVADGGEQSLDASAAAALAAVEVEPGHVLQLIIDPSGNYGADTTRIEWTIRELDGEQRQWDLTRDVTRDFLAANPQPDQYGHADVWLFLDGRSGSPLSEPVRNLSDQPGLHVWRSGDNPSVFVNSTDQPIGVWTTLPPRSLFVHPAPDGPVALAWISPLAGRVRVTGRIVDGHPGGPTGVGWQLKHLVGDQRPALRRLQQTADALRKIQLQREELVAQAPVREVAYAVTEGTSANARVQLRGDPEQLGDEVPRRWLELFGGARVPADGGSGRLALAAWLTDPHNPLVARVMVNRIWQHHFGQGLVRTPNDFGTRGQPPTHPELLDWLATRFIESGWDIQAMHRLILRSSAYRQAAGDPSSPAHQRGLAVDPTNELYWRFERRRLSAEELRDSLLSVSGQLDLRPGGPHPIPPTSSWSFTQHVPFAGVPETNQRSVYQLTLRNRRPVFMGLFDGPDPNASTPKRQETTVPTQALYFMNDAFFHGQAEQLALRCLAAPDDETRLTELFRLALQRGPTAPERAAAGSFRRNYEGQLAETPANDRPLAIWSAYARILLASNEFLYLD